ncbi:hypothetical protein NIES3806_32490 [Microcystis aeruginosa NIES-3806]|uniref:DUF3370 domain-containing protein n=1 Tax=Microcystis aeruginosa TaxID=1126 RepID=UPI00130B3AD3|nr:DUF3370 domain-containing protein [Microcystis aeruginosa]GCL55893.1 hypothetical protein NIES3806_32490 [Microcystis aeruginosa NIES-3806]
MVICVMLPFLLPIAQTPPIVEIIRPAQVRPLPNQLDQVPVFNSNSPELLLGEGILLSTFPPQEKSFPSAHLNYAFQGRFDIFVHHVARGSFPDNLRTLYLGILLHNPSPNPVTVKILQGASYLSQPDAAFIDLPAQVENNQGTVFAGPGSRVMGDILMGQRQDIFPDRIIIPAGESFMVLNAAIPVRDLTPPLNGRSTYLRLESDGLLYAASLALYAPLDENGQERPPNLTEWQNLLERGDLSTPRDRAPTPPHSQGQIIYGRVAGVSQGSAWQARLVDRASLWLNIPDSGQSIAYGISTLPGGKLGTEQNQSASMLVRYPDTAYQAHGNYGVEYRLSLPLFNGSDEAKTVTIALETPIKEDVIGPGLRFLDPAAPQVFFRGTVAVNYSDDQGQAQSRFFHLVQRRGQEGQSLVSLTIPPGDWRVVQVNFLYPPDATPPQVLTIKTE